MQACKEAEEEEEEEVVVVVEVPAAVCERCA
jgi:hypothetical protein